MAFALHLVFLHELLLKKKTNHYHEDKFIKLSALCYSMGNISNERNFNKEEIFTEGKFRGLNRKILKLISS